MALLLLGLIDILGLGGESGCQARRVAVIVVFLIQYHVDTIATLVIWTRIIVAALMRVIAELHLRTSTIVRIIL